ncbi:hypothetical protein QFC21_000062 [Naganishia friedmannii]|uniref:Uncharacterized protein n=1 Tax=Naganishia friedmannii TaxID=89922 RepID=A0ACC2WAS5_9TREE|nr:hypothetical protein QFC21_000062 [Naganishia friedmannii]
MAPHHHLRSAFVTNPALFSFPASAAALPSCATPLVQQVVEHVQGISVDSPHRRSRTRINTLSPIAGTERRSAVHGAGQVSEPFWKGFMTGKISSRARERNGANASLQTEETEGKQVAQSIAKERKRALVFAGLGSYPHQPTSPTAASLRLWERASEALVTPCSKTGYVPRAIEQEKSAMSGSLGDGMDPALWRRWNKGWLRGWVGNRSINELMSRPDTKAAYVITSNLAILASAQSHAPEHTSFLPQDVTHLLGYGFIGTLTALVATDKVKLEDAVRLACIYASLPAGGIQDDSTMGTGAMRDHFMTTLLTLSHDTSRTRKYSLSDAVAHHHHRSPLSAPSSSSTTPISSTISSAPSPLAHVLDVIRDLQEHEGWNENLLAEAEDEGYGVHGGDYGDWTTKEWAGEAMINSPRTLVVSGTKGAVIKIIDRLRGGGLATPVMDLHMPSVFQFRQALKGCPFHPSGGANGLTSGKCEPDVVILDGMTAKPVSGCGPPLSRNFALPGGSALPMDDIPSALTAYLTRPLQWAETTRSLWATPAESQAATANEGGSWGGGTPPRSRPLVDEISIVGRGARGLGIAIDREIGETRLQRQREGNAASSGTGTGRNAGRTASFRRRPGSNVFPMTAVDARGGSDANVAPVRVVEYDFEEKR